MEGVFCVGIGWFGGIGCVLALITCILLWKRPLWPVPMLVAVWILDALLVFGLAVLGMLLFPVGVFAFFEWATWLDGGHGWTKFQPIPAAWSTFSTTLGGGWIFFAVISTLLSGFRRSLPACLWVLMTACAGLVAIPVVFLVYSSGEVAPLGMVFALLGLLCEIGLVIVLALMSVRSTDPR